MSTLSREELGKLAQFKLLMRKVHQYSVDLSALVRDQEYSRQVFDLAEDTDQEDLMLLAIELRAQFGLLGIAAEPAVDVQPVATAPTAIADTPPTEQMPKEEKSKERYKGSLR